MPYSKNTVFETTDLPDEIPFNVFDETYFITLKGGDGGNRGEKGYKAQLKMNKAILPTSVESVPINSSTYNCFNFVEIGQENDAGYAINYIDDANNRCSVTIANYNPYSSIDIYNTGTQFSFSNLYSGYVNSSASISHGGSYGNFTVLNSTGISPILDTGLNLNKYYLPFNNNLVLQKRILLEDSANPSNSAISSNVDSLFCFYVYELDYSSSFCTFSTQEFNLNFDTLIFVNNIGEFAVDDLITVSHPMGYYAVTCKIDSVSGSELQILSVEELFNLTSIDVTFPVGSIITIKPFVNTFSTILDSSFSSELDLLPYFSNGQETNGLFFKLNKGISNSSTELFNSLTFSSDSCFCQPQTINKKIDRIYPREYAQTQYGSDQIKLQIKNKPKFNIFYHGFRKINNRIFYICGDQKSAYLIQDVTSQITCLDGLEKYLYISNPNVLTYGYRKYYDFKLYETLFYQNLNFNAAINPISLILSSLTSKYKEKLVFSPIEFLSSDMYYSKVDGNNLFGKLKKS